ncbi:MAG: hypothetical protein F9K16_14470 [Thermoanaerobaculia bacterium]|nr:MAG: hypothetical protein F9K16_14470 [Thermoanaerobaculia bacterium]
MLVLELRVVLRRREAAHVLKGKLAEEPRVLGRDDPRREDALEDRLAEERERIDFEAKGVRPGPAVEFDVVARNQAGQATSDGRCEAFRVANR